MLNNILHILGILGIILLVLLCIVLVLILLVLFFPIFYRIKADRQPVNSDSSSEATIYSKPQYAMHADIKVQWLFGLLRVRYRYPEPGILKVKFLFFTIYKMDLGLTENDENETFEPNPHDQPQTENAPVSSDDKIYKSEEESDSPPANNSLENSEANDEFSDDSKTILEKIQYTIQNICDKIKDTIEKIKEVYNNISYYKNVLLCEDTKGLVKYALTRLGKILKSIRPRKLRADIYFGADSPDTTGYVCAAYGIICSHLGKNIIFTPDFEQAILKGNLYAAGHITIFTILWNALMIIKDRRLWELKDKLTKNRKNT